MISYESTYAFIFSLPLPCKNSIMISFSLGTSLDNTALVAFSSIAPISLSSKIPFKSSPVIAIKELLSGDSLIFASISFVSYPKFKNTFSNLK